MIGRARRWIAVAIIVVGLTAIVVAWAIPTFGGRVFVEVRARIVPVASEAVRGTAIVLPDGTTAVSGRFRVDIEISNHYPLPVLIDFRGSAFRAALIGRDASASEPIWQTSADDPPLEQADESPDGSDTGRVTVVAPGTTLLPTGEPGITIDLDTMTAVDPGIYTLEVSAYGIEGSPQYLSIGGIALAPTAATARD